MLSSSIQINIREFRYPEDYPAVYALWQNAGPGIHVRRSDEPEEIARKLERDPDLFLFAEVDGEVIGSVLGGFDGRRGMMYHLAVAESVPPAWDCIRPGRRAGTTSTGQRLHPLLPVGDSR